MRSTIKILIIIPALSLFTCSSEEGGGDLGYYPTSNEAGNLNCPKPNASGFSLNTVVYEGDVANFIDANCASCHGDGNTANLDFRSYQSAKDTLEARNSSFTLKKIVDQVRANHNAGAGGYDPTDLALLESWESDGFQEKAAEGNNDDDESNSEDDNSGDPNDLNSTIQDTLDQFNQNNGATTDSGGGLDTQIPQGSANQQGC